VPEGKTRGTVEAIYVAGKGGAAMERVREVV